MASESKGSSPAVGLFPTAAHDHRGCIAAALERAETVCLARDVRLTDLRRREQDSIGRAADLESILENIEQGVVLFDRDMKIVVYNERLRDFLELDKSFDAHGMTLDEILHYLAERGEYASEEKQAAIALRMRLMHSRQPFTNDRERRDGRIVSVHYEPLPNGGGVMTYSDVTQARRHDAQRRGADRLGRSGGGRHDSQRRGRHQASAQGPGLHLFSSPLGDPPPFVLDGLTSGNPESPPSVNK